jgi:hypothetical protein
MTRLSWRWWLRRSEQRQVRPSSGTQPDPGPFQFFRDAQAVKNFIRLGIWLTACATFLVVSILVTVHFVGGAALAVSLVGLITTFVGTIVQIIQSKKSKDLDRDPSE